MKRYSLVDGKMVEDPAGKWAPMSEVRDFALVAARVGRDHDRYARALAKISAIPVSMPPRMAVPTARQALEPEGS